jgi:hypothetical protein
MGAWESSCRTADTSASSIVGFRCLLYSSLARYRTARNRTPRSTDDREPGGRLIGPIAPKPLRVHLGRHLELGAFALERVLVGLADVRILVAIWQCVAALADLGADSWNIAIRVTVTA